MKFKVDGMTISLDDLVGMLAFIFAMVVVHFGEYGLAIIAGAVALVCGVPEDDPNRKWPEIFFGFAVILGVVLEYFYLQYVPFGPNLPSVIYLTSGILGALINGLEVVTVASKWISNCFAALCKNSDTREKDALQGKLAKCN